MKFKSILRYECEKKAFEELIVGRKIIDKTFRVIKKEDLSCKPNRLAKCKYWIHSNIILVDSFITIKYTASVNDTLGEVYIKPTDIIFNNAAKGYVLFTPNLLDTEYLRIIFSHIPELDKTFREIIIDIISNDKGITPEEVELLEYLHTYKIIVRKDPLAKENFSTVINYSEECVTHNSSNIGSKKDIETDTSCLEILENAKKLASILENRNVDCCAYNIGIDSNVHCEYCLYLDDNDTYILITFSLIVCDDTNTIGILVNNMKIASLNLNTDTEYIIFDRQLNPIPNRLYLKTLQDNVSYFKNATIKNIIDIRGNLQLKNTKIFQDYDIIVIDDFIERIRESEKTLSEWGTTKKYNIKFDNILGASNNKIAGKIIRDADDNIIGEFICADNEYIYMDIYMIWI